MCSVVGTTEFAHMESMAAGLGDDQASPRSIRLDLWRWNMQTLTGTMILHTSCAYSERSSPRCYFMTVRGRRLGSEEDDLAMAVTLTLQLSRSLEKEKHVRGYSPDVLFTTTSASAADEVQQQSKCLVN